MKSEKCKVPGSGSGALSTFYFSLLTFVALAGCAARGRLRESPDPGLRRSYAAPPDATRRALLEALHELGFRVQAVKMGSDPLFKPAPEKGSDPFFTAAEIAWPVVADRGRFESDLPVLPHADFACRIAPGPDGGSLVSATVTARPGSSPDGREAVGRRRGDVVMIVFNRTQDLLAGGKRRTPNDK